MKSKLWIIPALVLCLVSCLAFTSCGNDAGDEVVPSAVLDMEYVEGTDKAAEHFKVIGVKEGDENTFLKIPDIATYEYTVEEEVLDAEGNTVYDDNGNPVTETKSYSKEVPVTEIVSRAFYNNANIEAIEIGNNVTSIGDRAFDSCKSVTTVKIGTGITAIPEKAFINCNSLTAVSIPQGIKSIGVSAFEGCSSLAAVEFEAEGLTSIATRAFYGCASIEKIKIPSTVTFIDVDVFTGCEKILERASVEEDGLTVYTDSVTYVDSWIVSWDKEDKNSYKVVVKDGTFGIAALAFESDALHPIETITFPASVHTAVDNAFSECLIVKAIAPAPVFKVVPLNTLEIAVIDGGSEIAAGSFAGAPKLTSVEIKGNVTKIGASAFEGCKKLAEIKIEASVSEIKDSAFKDCTAITSFDVTSGCTKIESSAFQGCTALATIKLNNVKSIGDFAFAYCQALTTVTLPDSAKTLGESVFYNCNALTTVKLPAGATKIPAHFFHGCAALGNVTIPETVTQIGAYAFSECDAITEITIPGAVTAIDDAVFAGCNSLASVVAPAITSIGNYAFYRCIALEGFTIAEGCTSIGTSAFEGCSSIAAVTVPGSVTSIGNYAFYECSALGSITLPSELKHVGKNVFASCEAIGFTVENGGYYLGNNDNQYMILVKIDGTFGGAINSNTKIIGNNVFENYSQATINLPESVIQIGEEAFLNSTISSIVLPSAIETIGNGVFKGCASLITVDIPASLKSISNYAFSGCASLTGITINGEVAIGRFAFENCDKIESLALLNTVTYLDDYAFSGCDSLKAIEITQINGVGSYALFGAQITKATLPAEAFAGMDTSTLKEVIITSGKLGKKVFEGCVGLEKVTIMDAVTDVDATAFDGCTGVLEVVDGLVYVDTWVVNYQNKFNMEEANKLPYHDVVIKEGTVGIATAAFAMQTQNYGGNISYLVPLIKNLIVPASVKHYSKTAFKEAYVKGASIPASMIASLDKGKERLETLTVTSGEIPASALKDCKKLYSVTIGEGVTAIADGAFKGCDKLVEVCNLSALEITKGSSDFGYVAKNAINVYGKDGGETKLATTDTNVVYIKDGAKIKVVGFASNENNLVLPKQIEGKDYEVYKYAFYYCPNIFTVTLEEGASISIGESAFEDSVNITTVTFKGKVSSIGAYAFTSSKLGYVYFAFAPDSLGSKALPALKDASSLRICYHGNADDFKNFSADIKNATYSYSEAAPTTAGRFWHYKNGEIVIWPAVK